MLTPTRLVIALGLAIGTVTSIAGQIATSPITSNPIPAPITKRGLQVEIKDLVRLPDTRGVLPADQDVTPAGWARISYVRDLPDGRRFVNDSRGRLYLIAGARFAAHYAHWGFAPVDPASAPSSVLRNYLRNRLSAIDMAWATGRPPEPLAILGRLTRA